MIQQMRKQLANFLHLHGRFCRRAHIYVCMCVCMYVCNNHIVMYHVFIQIDVCPVAKSPYAPQQSRVGGDHFIT